MILDIIYLIIFVFIGMIFPGLFLTGKDSLHKRRLKQLLGFHFLLGIAFFFYTRNGGGDAWGYWLRSKNMTSVEFWTYLYESKGTLFIYSLNYIPANVLEMSFFANTMLYSLLGYIGIVFFYLTAIRTIPNNSQFKGYKLFPLLFFLPNLHFWSSGVGKDTLLFLCIGMFSYAMLSIVKRIPLLIFSLLLSYLIRPHITLFLLIGFALAFLLDKKVSTFKRLILIVILISASLVILPTVMEFAKIEEASIDSFNQFSENKAEALSRSHTGSSVDISSYSFPLKVFTFLYRPLFFDINAIPAIIASFENLLLLILTIKVLKSRPKETFFEAPFVIKGLLFFLIIGTLAFSQTLGNVGIMIRMRNMFLPGMLIYILWAMSYQREIMMKFKSMKSKGTKVLS